MEQFPGTGRTFEIYAETEYSHVTFVYFRAYPSLHVLLER